jgi:uncharacterized membrane protein YfcA
MSGDERVAARRSPAKLTDSVGNDPRTLASEPRFSVDPLIIAFGLGVGTLVGITGMGGGALMTPILILIFGFQPTTAIGTDLAYGAVTKTVGGWRHFRQGNVDFTLSAWMGVGSVPAAVTGVIVLEKLKNTLGESFDDTVIIAVGAALALTAVAMLAKFLFFPGSLDRERETIEMRTKDKVGAVVLGIFVGFVLGVTSAGSGSLIAVGLIMFFRMVPRRVVGTDIFHAAVLLWAASIAHLFAGNIDFGLAGTILLGSIPGVYIGSRLMMHVPAAGLRVALAVVLMASSLALFSKAGADFSPALILGAPAAVGAALLVHARLRTARRRRQGLPGQAAPAEG